MAVTVRLQQSLLQCQQSFCNRRIYDVFLMVCVSFCNETRNVLNEEVLRNVLKSYLSCV